MGPILTAVTAVICFICRKGLVRKLIWVLLYCYLKLTRRFTRRRLDLYDYWSNQPEKIGLIIPHEEWNLESPQSADDVEKNTDVVFCNGVNSSSEGLVIGLYRHGNGKVQISLVLRLANGSIYSMPPEHSLQPETDETHTFGCSRVKMQCLLPMRKWRVFFNGMLRETSNDLEDHEERYRHVKFTFIWTASSDVFDNRHDASPKVQADAAAQFWTWECPPLQLLRRMRRTADGYEQCGMLLGTVSIEDQPEKEVFLWGLRGRYMDITLLSSGKRLPFKYFFIFGRSQKAQGLENMEDEPKEHSHIDVLSSVQDVMQERKGSKGEQYKQYHSFDAFINAENGTFIRLGIFNEEGHIEDMPYGYVMRPNGFILPIESCIFFKMKEGIQNDTHFVCAIDGEKFTVKLSEENLRSNFHGRFNAVTSINQLEGLINSMPARGFILETKVKMELKPSEQSPPHPETLHKYSSMPKSTTPLSLPFHNPLCQMLSVSGGKGSSLAKLTCISEEWKSFTVPKGIVVTTRAYSAFTQNFLPIPMKKLQEVVWKQDQDKTAVRSACVSVMNEIIIANLPNHVAESIGNSLNEVFGKDINNIRFAVRSSATGEDTEQMSAAGQMETFLGCKGISELLLSNNGKLRCKKVLSAVKKCWASQFSFVAVEYKRRYGQPLDTPMAVVIQEMVPCDAAGVAFTCDPVTGNPSYVSITANYGLGESVVSASADPDTITLKRDIKDKLHMHSKTTGMKQTKIVMDESGGTKEVRLDHDVSSEYSISEETALKLGDITVKIEMHFGTPRDIEWGVLCGKIFLFQARPVTTIDTITDFEAARMFDSFIRREDEFLSTANVGEVLPGATTPLGTDFLDQMMELSFLRQKFSNWDGNRLPSVPYFSKRFCRSLNHWFVRFCDAFMNFSENDPENISSHTKATSLSVFGRILNDKKYFDVAKDRYASEKKTGLTVTNMIHMKLYMFFGKYFAENIRKIVEKCQIPIKEDSSSLEIFSSITKNCQAACVPATNVHMNCSFASSSSNMRLLSLLGEAKGEWDNDVLRDFGYLQSTIKEVESADVPASIQNLGSTISRSTEPERFKKMSADEALQWLQTTTEAGKAFSAFLHRHGHRCLKEFDLRSKTWAMDPRSLVKILQDVVTKSTESPKKKKSDSFQDIVSNMLIPLNFFQRLQLRLHLPNCHRGIRQREMSKSLLIKSYNTVRLPFCQLADVMVCEGRLPNRDLLFFLCVEEIHQLIKTRSPTLVIRAFRRWKLHPELDKLIFPEISSGIPRPMNMNEELDISGDGFSMTGIPVSHGVVKGIARVVISIKEAPNIQHDDILITYSTDVAWSPYFPLLSGVVTELGGLISHGAVVAREYGLPCVVGLKGATRAFKSGDFVLLDGNRGVLQKLENP